MRDREGAWPRTDLKPCDVLDEQTRGRRTALCESGQHVFNQVQERLCARICGSLRLRVEYRIRLARRGQEPEVGIERLERGCI